MTANVSVNWSAIADSSSGGAVVGDPMTLAPGGQTMVLANAANLAASPSGVIECVVIAPANPSNTFVGLVSGRLSRAQVPYGTTSSDLGDDPYAVVDALGRIVRATNPGDNCIGLFGLDGSVTLILAMWGGFLGGGNQPSPTVTAITPSRGFRRGSGLIRTVTGTNFTVDTICSINGIPCPLTTYVNGTTLTVTTPTLASDGPFNVTVTNPGVPPATLTNGYKIVPNCLAWFRGPSGFTPSAWTDNAEVPHNAVQATGGNQPAVATAAINGKNCVDFAGTKFMTIPVSLVTANSPYTVVVVGKNVNGCVFSVRKSLTYAASLLFIVPPYYVHGDGVNASANITTADYSAITANPAVAFKSMHRYKGGATDPDIFIQGILRAITSGGTFQTTETGPAGCQIGSSTALGDQYANGIIGELWVFAGAISPTDRADVDQYILEEWGIAL